MNNKEKRQYIDCLTLMGQNCYITEIQKRNQVLRRSPNTLFKYRSFDKFAFEMIENKYAYLSPVKDLDDPFDCISDFDLSGLYSECKDTVRSEFVNYIIKTNKHNLTSEQILDLKKSLQNCMGSGGFDLDKTAIELHRLGIPDKEAMQLATLFVNCQNLYNAYDEAKTFDAFAKVAYNPGDYIGVCSLSEIRDNKVMWSLYGDKYKGYCIEYDVPLTKEARKSLYPVLYSRRISNNFTRKMYDTIMAEVKRNVFHDVFTVDPQIKNVGVIYELFCLKDTDWKYQQERRIIGDAGGYFTNLKIKSIYLGFKVSKSNELRIKKLSKKYGFSVFKMNPPNGKKKISYTKLS